MFDKYDISIGDDYFTGTYDGVHISIGEQKLKTVGEDFRGNKIEKDVFSGVIYYNEGNLRCKENQAIRDEILLEQFDWYPEGVEFYED